MAEGVQTEHLVFFLSAASKPGNSLAGQMEEPNVNVDLSNCCLSGGTSTQDNRTQLKEKLGTSLLALEEA